MSHTPDGIDVTEVSMAAYPPVLDQIVELLLGARPRPATAPAGRRRRPAGPPPSPLPGGEGAAPACSEEANQ